MKNTIKIDIIILSFAKTDELRDMTLNCVESLMISEKQERIIFKILVIESNKQMQPYQYPNTKTIYPGITFGFNKFMNIGISQTSNPYVCLCNNDLLFFSGWATEILKVFDTYSDIESANPYSDNFEYDVRVINGENVIRRNKNLNINGILTGWCIFVKRSVLKKIGPLDEQFTFWYADNDYDMTLRKYGISHALVKSSVVNHLACQSHDLLSDRKDELTKGQRAVFERKWKKKSIVKRILDFAFKVFSNIVKSFKSSKIHVS